MNKYYTVVILFLGFLLVSEAKAIEQDIVKYEKVDLIEVMGQKPLARFRDEYNDARLAVFETFNNYVEDTDMHYICARERLINSRIHHTICQNAFDIRIKEELFRREINNSWGLLSRLNRAQTSSFLGTQEMELLKQKRVNSLKTWPPKTRHLRQS